jgi:hypothetical protein
MVVWGEKPLVWIQPKGRMSGPAFECLHMPFSFTSTVRIIISHLGDFDIADGEGEGEYGVKSRLVMMCCMDEVQVQSISMFLTWVFPIASNKTATSLARNSISSTVVTRAYSYRLDLFDESHETPLWIPSIKSTVGKK